MPRTPSARDPQQLTEALQTLNARWSRRALALWQGLPSTAAPDAVYAGFEDLLTPAAIAAAAQIEDANVRIRIRHGLIDHYLQRTLMPHEMEMQAWSRGAAAHVDGDKIYFREVIPWCQKSSTLEKRGKLQRETTALCKLLKPFALNYWQVVLETLTDELGFADYVDYCRQKKGIDYARLYALAKRLLQVSDPFYFDAMDAWSRDRFGRDLHACNRFDAIYLLSLSQWDPLCPIADPRQTLAFFDRWGLDVSKTRGLHLHLEPAEKKSAQALSVMIRIPEEVHLLMRPEGGWIDLETLWHELGHGLAAVCTDPCLPAVDRELATAFGLSEVYAFLLQRMALSRPVLASVLKLPDATVDLLTYYRELKDLSVFRRYAAKFISEYDMFTRGDLADGAPYADIMARATGFYHQPESHLFDLVPEFYCADYLLGWLGEAVLSAHLVDRFGESGYVGGEAGRWLKQLWRQGNAADIPACFEKNGIGPLDETPLLARWERLARMATPAP